MMLRSNWHTSKIRLQTQNQNWHALVHDLVDPYLPSIDACDQNMADEITMRYRFLSNDIEFSLRYFARTYSKPEDIYFTDHHYACFYSYLKMSLQTLPDHQQMSASEKVVHLKKINRLLLGSLIVADKVVNDDAVWVQDIANAYILLTSYLSDYNYTRTEGMRELTQAFRFYESQLLNAVGFAQPSTAEIRACIAQFGQLEHLNETRLQPFKSVTRRHHANQSSFTIFYHKDAGAIDTSAHEPVNDMSQDESPRKLRRTISSPTIMKK